MSIRRGNIIIAGTAIERSIRNVGESFYTTRTDSSLAGAVEADGGEYNIADYSGEGSVGELLKNGKLAYVSREEFQNQLDTSGGCDSFAWDGEGYTWYAWNHEITSAQSSSGDIAIYAADSLGFTLCYTKTTDTANIDRIYVKNSDGTFAEYTNLDNDRGDDWISYGSGNKFYRDSTKDIIIAGDLKFLVPYLAPRKLVKTQKPTEENGYAWYNLYSDGYVEQGGKAQQPTGTTDTAVSKTITLPITMNDTAYSAVLSGFAGVENTTGGGFSGLIANNLTKASFDIYGWRLATNIVAQSWVVTGYADEDTYTKDKWDYQNVKVCRPMVQLANSASDQALVTAGSVVADISNLKQTKQNKIIIVKKAPETGIEGEIYALVEPE